MNLPIQKIHVSKDGFVYVRLKVPKIKGTDPMLDHVTVKYSDQSIVKLLAMKEKEKEEQSIKGGDKDGKNK